MAARTIPVLPSWAAGTRVLASNLQAITTWGNFQANLPMFSMYQSIGQSVGGSSFTQITCDTSDYDSDSGRNNSTPFSYTIPSTMGGTRWDLRGSVSWATNATGARLSLIYKNGSLINGAVVQANNANANNTNLFIAREVLVAAGDVIALYGWQASGGSLSTNVSSSWPSFLEGRMVSQGNP